MFSFNKILYLVQYNTAFVS